MVTCFLDFHENIRFWKTVIQYQEQPYPIEKATIVFLDPRKKAWNIRSIFMEQSGNVPIFNIPGTLFRNIPRNFIGNFLRIYWEYLKETFEECSTNICLPGGKICNDHRISERLWSSRLARNTLRELILVRQY